MNHANQELTGKPWSREEVDAIISDYFHMLRLSLLGQKVNKSAHRRVLQGKLYGRSEKAIDMKHQNISAVLIELGAMPLVGYRGLPNYQNLLMEVVSERLEQDHALDKAALDAVSRSAEPVLAPDYSRILVPPPKPPNGVQEERPPFARIAVKRDYVERESRNRSLGEAGELLVMNYEAHRLRRDGKPRLAEKIDHVSRTKGDGLGYDVLSYELDGRERFIEVKTTAFAETTPFFISANEVRFSEEFAAQFHLYRLFAFRDDPKMFQIAGSIRSSCRLDPANYRARVL